MQVYVRPLTRPDFSGTSSFAGDWMPAAGWLNDARVIVGQPLHVSGEVWKEDGCLVAEVELSARLTLRCDRCDQPYDQALELRFPAWFCPPDRLAAQEERLGDSVFLGEWQGDTIDLQPAILEQAVFALPGKKLCRPDCKGICPECGQNWNEGGCDCRPQEIDPRLAGLQQWLKASETSEEEHHG